ncbi:short-chain dehydrogenase [Pochonia chlamydosporia 170]|uniref:3beta-hydroxysteroid 3-dehydrogenase n=1 Tax=Pochonia chlamydosporia 170 TaxID=1380566 RepID=A0A179F330_METCM|nr:short-chain dehydrogenase [Pochonia chlamydosporia 170]OAQ59573.1 short-chain dehydrogenase [Pochonia chlamydosporia 170]
MAGLIIFTGGNSSMGIPAADHLLQKYPEYTVIFTVRDASDDDINTKTLRDTISKHPNSKASVLALDLASLSGVHDFADNIIAGIQSRKYPRLAAIVCNAYYWNLIGDPEFTEDGYDKTIQVSHISHAALVLRLLESFDARGGRIVLISSDSHWPGKNAMEKYPPSIDDLENLVNPAVDDDKQGRGYQRYATAKLAITTWIYALNRHLEKDPNLKNVTAIAVNPGNMVDSRALRTNTPPSLHKMQTFVYRPLLPILRLIMGPTLRTAAPAGADVVDLTLSPEYAGKRGFFTLLQDDESSPDSRDEEKQARLWKQTLLWAKVTKDSTVLQGAFEE